MKILFSTLLSVKKEAKRIRKFLTKNSIAVSSQETQDLVAQFYGWKHYNEMSAHHRDRFKLDRTLKRLLLNAESGVSMEHSHISGIDPVQRNLLEVRKKTLFTALLVKYGRIQSNASLCYAFFDEPRLTRDENAFVSLSQINSDNLRRHFLLTGNSKSKKVKFYDDMVVPRAKQNGGKLFLSYSSYEKIKHGLEGPLAIMNLSNKHIESEDLISLDFDSLPYENKVNIINAYMRSCRTQSNDQTIEIVYRPQLRLMNLYLDASRQHSGLQLLMKGELDEYTCNQIAKAMRERDEEGFFRDSITAPLSFNEQLKGIKHWINKVRTQFNEAQQQMQGGLSGFKVEDVFSDQKTTVIVFDDEDTEKDAIIECVLALFRTTVAPKLGSAIEGHSEFIKKIDFNNPTPMVLESYQRYMIKGFSIVAAQLRSLGHFVCFDINDVNQAILNDYEEWMSTKANTTHTLYFDKPVFNAADHEADQTALAQVYDEGGLVYQCKQDYGQPDAYYGLIV